MNKHTHGPWAIDDFFNNKKGRVISKPGECGDVIAEASVSEAISKSEAQANARLIAKAPQLFDAVKEYAIEIQSKCEGWGERKEQHPDWRYLQELNALITEVEGELHCPSR